MTKTRSPFFGSFAIGDALHSNKTALTTRLGNNRNSQMMKRRALLVITTHPPFPPNHGATVDQWNRYRLMTAMGWDIVLATWVPRADESLVAELQRALQDVCSEVFLFSNWSAPAILRRIAYIRSCPPSVSSRNVSKGDRAALMARLCEKKVSGVLLEGLGGALLGRSVASELGLPIFLRSHNIEHRYLPMLSRAASSWGEKLQVTIAGANMKRFETDLHRGVDWSFDCSSEDLAFWKSHGISKQTWLPPLFNTSRSSNTPRKDWGARSYDAVYLGNLSTPNNVEGVLWFLGSVLPFLVAQRPNMKILIAGSNPSTTIVRAMRKHPEIDFTANPEDPVEIRSLARVLINPILNGSGINVKSIEMLFTDSPIVTTSLGVQGLAPRYRGSFIIVDTPGGFAKAMLAALDRGRPIDDAERAALRVEFGEAGAKQFSNDLYDKIVRFAL